MLRLLEVQVHVKFPKVYFLTKQNCFFATTIWQLCLQRLCVVYVGRGCTLRRCRPRTGAERTW